MLWASTTTSRHSAGRATRRLSGGRGSPGQAAKSGDRPEGAGDVVKATEALPPVAFLYFGGQGADLARRAVAKSLADT